MAGLEGPNGGEVKQDGGKRLDPLVLLRKCAIAGQNTLKGRLVAGRCGKFVVEIPVDEVVYLTYPDINLQLFLHFS